MRQDGVWAIYTETGSIYRLDLDSHSVMRCPDPDNAQSVNLRRDGDEIPIYGLVHEPMVGSNLCMIMEPLQDGVVTTVRTTSAIVRIEELIGDGSNTETR